MLDVKLTPGASVLYRWILGRNPAGGQLKIDLQDFQAWTGEYREKPYSDREICEALAQLKELKLLEVAKTEVTLNVKYSENFSGNERSPAEMLLAESDVSKRDSLQYNFASRQLSPLKRLLLLLKITSGSLALSFTSVVLGLTLAQTQPHTLTNPHPWSALIDNNISLSN